MYIRCPKCMASTRFGPAALAGRPCCGSCAHPFSLEALGQLGSTPEERFLRAEEHARSNSIDLASAYAVLLGIFPIDRALRVSHADASPERPGLEEAPVGGAVQGYEDGYDPSFNDAVATGRLTVWGAIQRGDRVAYASRLSQKHSIPMDLSFLVADNQMPLTEAREISESRKHRRHAGSSGAPGSSAWLALALGVSVLLSGSLWRLREAGAGRSTEPAFSKGSKQPASVVASGQVHADRSGQVVAVEAPTPDAVLDLYCRSTRAIDTREPIRVVPSGSGESLGVFREAGLQFAIRIRKDPISGRDVAGDGQNPLLPEPASVPGDTF